MSSARTHTYTLKISLKSLQANCQRPSCKVHILIKIDNQQRKLKQIGEMKKNIATWTTDLLWEDVVLRYDEISGTYLDTMMVIGVHYETSEQGAKSNKLKVGQVTVNLGKLLNTKTYRISNQYPLQKCYDPNAKLKMAIDLTQAEQRDQQHGPTPSSYPYLPTEPSNDGRQQLRHSAISGGWRVSKIREKMNDDQKTMLQNKLYEYEDRMGRYREECNEQVRRLGEQLEKKDEKMAGLLGQISSLTQALQVSQSQFQKTKTKLTALQKQHITLQQQHRQQNTKIDSLTRQLTTKKHELEHLTTALQQLQQTKQKKQQHYKAQLEKYLHRYTESENGRNRIVFQMENKLREELAKKEEYYQEIVGKLEAKLQSSGTVAKDVIVRRERELVVVSEKCVTVEKELGSVKLALAQAQQYNQSLQQHLAAMTAQLTKYQQRTRSLESESQLSSHSNTNLLLQLQKHKNDQKLTQKTVQQLKYQLEMANKTIEQQDAMIVKLNRNIQMYREREYYMEEKYEGELEMKSYNEECMIGSNNYYKNLVRKLEIKVKFLEEKVEDCEIAVQNGQKQKHRLEEEIKNGSRQLFENGHQILRLQSQNKRLSQKSQQLQLEKHQKQLLLLQLQQRLTTSLSAHESQTNSYIVTINELQRKVKQATQKLIDSENEWEEQFQMDSMEKNQLLAQLEAQVEKMKDGEMQAKAIVGEREGRIQGLLAELQVERDRNRALQREQSRLKFQLTKANDQKESTTKDQQKLKTTITQLKNQLQTHKTESQKLSRKCSRQRDSYTELIKWILNRNWGNDRQFVQQAGSEIELQLVSVVNTGLERFYAVLDRNAKAVEELREENQRILEQWNHAKLEMRYEQQFGKKQIKQFQYNWQYTVQPQKPSTIIQPIVDISSSYEISKMQQLKALNSQLQRDFTNKLAQIESLNEELFEERTKVREISDEVHHLRQEVEDLNLTVTKKTSVINSLQAQLSERQVDMSSFSSSFNTKSPGRNVDYKNEAESKYKEQKIVAQLERRLEELDRQNSLQKSKMELLEGKLKTTSEKNLAEGQRISSLERSLKQKQETIRKLAKDNEQKELYLDKTKKQLELSLSKLSKKQTTLEQIRGEIQQQRKINQILAKQVEQWENKFSQKEKKIERESYQNQKILLETTESLAIEKMEKEKLNLEQGAQIANLKSTLKQAQRRIASLQALISKSKSQNQELYQKYIRQINEKNQLEEQIKDIKMNQTLTKQSFEKNITDLQQKLQNKEFQFEQLRFSSESKIIQLERQLEERVIIDI